MGMMTQQISVADTSMTLSTSQFDDSSTSKKTSNSNWNELIQRAKGGCDLALLEIIKQFEAYLLMVARTGMRNSLQGKFGASDILQISLIEAHKSIDKFNGSCANEMRSWLKRIVLNNLFDQSKQYTGTHKRSLDRENPLGSLDFPSKLDTPSVMIRREETDAELMRLVNALPEKQRFVVEARHRSGLSYSEIASQLGTSEANARQLWVRALKQLRDRLGCCPPVNGIA